MGYNDPEAAKLGPKARGVVGASMPSRRAGDPRNSRSAAPLLSERMIGAGLILTNEGKIAVDFDAVERASGLRIPELSVALHTDISTNLTDTASPAGEQLLLGNARHVLPVDLSIYRQAWFWFNKRAGAGAANATLELRYSTTYSATSTDYSSICGDPLVLSTLPTNTVVKSEWTDMVPEARGLVYLALVTANGDGAANPSYGSIGAYFRR